MKKQRPEPAPIGELSPPRAVVPATHPLARGTASYAPAPRASETLPHPSTSNECRIASAPASTETDESSGSQVPPATAPSPPAMPPPPRSPAPPAPVAAQTHIAPQSPPCPNLNFRYLFCSFALA